MTRALDVKQLIAADSSSPAEERALQELARKLEGGLGQEVPHRPEFKAELRTQLVKAARQQLRPWYRRPAFLGSGVAVAAAAAVLVVGLNLWQRDGVQQVDPNAALTPPAAETTPGESTGHVVHDSSGATLVSLPSDLKQVALPDEPLHNAQYSPEAATAGATARRIELKRLTAKPDEEEFHALERQLAFRGESRRSTVGWSIDEGSRFLALTVDGRVTYQQEAPAAAAAGAIDVDGARQVARQFLDRALLPVPTAQPEVVREEGFFTVIYTEHLDGRPVVNARTTVQVEQHGTVVKAEAYVASGTVSGGAYDAVTEADALAAARAQGGHFDRADLVWVRTPGEEVVYLQPYWRVFGTDASGQSVVRYVAALKR